LTRSEQVAQNSLAIGPAGDRDIIVPGSADRTVRTWDAYTAQSVGIPLAGHGGAVNAVAIGRAGDQDIIAGSDDGAVLIGH
jgi:WD40 repeat protein